MKALIVAGGKPPSEELLRNAVDCGYDFIIAADSGAKVLLQYEVPFQLLVGDLDSLDDRSKEKIKESQEVIRLDCEKDFTDTEAAFHEAKKRGADEILILGATGTRQDHFMANLAVLKQALTEGIKAVLEDDHNVIFMTDRSLELEPREGWTPSFFPYGGDIQDFSLLNVKYPLAHHPLRGDSTRTVSNEFLQGPAKIKFSEGTVLVMLARDHA